MLVDPKQVTFQSEQDVINYITKGIIPPKKDATRVFLALTDPVNSDVHLEYDTTEEEASKLDLILETVYDNIAEFQKAAAVACGFSGLLGFILGRRFR